MAIDQKGNLKLHNYYLDHTFQKPRVFQLDENQKGKILPWNLNWKISDGIELDFLGSGSFDIDKPIYIEISNLPPAIVSYSKDRLVWVTYY